MPCGQVASGILPGSPPRARGHGNPQLARHTRATVHPRVRGDMADPVRFKHDAGGSPPRARGHGRGRNDHAETARFTPACAGTWTPSMTFVATQPVHPRVRGDMGTAITNALTHPGSPPRARGHVGNARPLAKAVRFTPACAGTWLRFQPSQASRPVHPRVRGDMIPYTGRPPWEAGSPPRARGHGRMARSHRARKSVHPRVRGDMLTAKKMSITTTGSPPRARGHVGRGAQRYVHRRFTPACAGTCPFFHARPRFLPVHPRVRGDMFGAGVGGGALIGSPPRARGHGPSGRSADSCRRFTPACAGTWQNLRGAS